MNGTAGRRTTPPVVVALGLVMADVRVRCPALPGPESDPRVETMRLELGGATANVLAALARDSAVTRLVSAVGDDALGRFLLGALDDAGVDRTHVAVVPGESASCLVLDTPPTHTLLWHLPPALEEGVRRLRPVLPAVLSGADAVHVNGRFPRLAAELCTLARAAGVPVSLNVGRGDVAEGAAELVRHADLLIAADGWAEEQTGEPGVPEACRELFRRHRAGVVSVTSGERGSWTAAGGEVFHTPAAAAPAGAVSTVGAGDAYHAGFLAAFLAGEEPRRCARRGAEAAARHCRAADAGTSVPPGRRTPEETGSR